jgi:hypothetical protein
VSGAPFVTKDARVDAASIIPYPHPKPPVVIPDLHFDPTRSCMAESIAQRFPCNPVDLIPQDRMQVLWRTFHLHQDSGRILARGRGCMMCCEVRTQGGNRRRQVVGDDCGRAQLVDRVPCLGDRLSGVIEGALECLLGFARTRWEQVINRLKIGIAIRENSATAYRAARGQRAAAPRRGPPDSR